MDSRNVSNSGQCSNCSGKHIIFSVSNGLTQASVCNSCHVRTQMLRYPCGIDTTSIENWFLDGGFDNVPYASQMAGRKLSETIIKNKEEILNVFEANKGMLKALENLEEVIRLINRANFPARYISYFGKELKDCLDEKTFTKVSMWVNKIENSKQSIVFYGPNGTGKTHAAVLTALQLIKKYKKSVLFISESEIFRLRKLISDTSIMEKSKNTHLHNFEILRNQMESVDCLLLDDVGAQSSSEKNLNVYNDIIDMRYKSGMLNLITTNHWKTPAESLGGKTLKNRIGARAADRIFGCDAVSMSGESRRQPVTDKSIVTREESETFSTLMCGVNGEVCFSFIARNPVFGILSKKSRSLYTDNDGLDIDVGNRTFNGTWHKDDKLTVFGPLLDINNDQKLYLVLLGLLNNSHKRNIYGVHVETSFSELLQKLGYKSYSDSAILFVKRSLERLKRVSIKYKGYDGKLWLGGFIDNVLYDGKNKKHKVIIVLNSCMIRFYEDKSYFGISIEKIGKMNDFAQVLYLFLESQKEYDKYLSLEVFSKLCGRESGVDKKFRDMTIQALKDLEGVLKLKI